MTKESCLNYVKPLAAVLLASVALSPCIRAEETMLDLADKTQVTPDAISTVALQDCSAAGTHIDSLRYDGVDKDPLLAEQLYEAHSEIQEEICEEVRTFTVIAMQRYLFDYECVTQRREEESVHNIYSIEYTTRDGVEVGMTFHHDSGKPDFSRQTRARLAVYDYSHETILRSVSLLSDAERPVGFESIRDNTYGWQLSSSLFDGHGISRFSFNRFYDDVSTRSDYLDAIPRVHDDLGTLVSYAERSC